MGVRKFWRELSLQFNNVLSNANSHHMWARQIHFYTASASCNRSSDGTVSQSALLLQIASVSYICKPISDAVTLGNGLEDFQDGARKYYGLVRNKQTRCFRYICAFYIVNTHQNDCKYIGFLFCHTFEPLNENKKECIQ